MKIKEYILKTFAILFIIGGVLRIFSTQSFYNSISLGDFWVDNVFFVLANRIIGTIILMIGIILWGLTKDFLRLRYILNYFSLTLFIMSLVIGFSGLSLSLPIYIYIPDAAFFFFSSVFCLYIKN